MEFAPDWLSSQGTEPLDVLDYLQHRCQFAEFQERIPFGTPNLDALFANPVQAERHREFLGYVKSLNKNDLGWVDMIMRPRPWPRVFKSRMQLKIIVKSEERRGGKECVSTCSARGAPSYKKK